MRKTTQLKILNTSSIDELRKSFQELASKKLKFLNLDLVIFPEDFDHCCYEYLEGGVYKGKFSQGKEINKNTLLELVEHKK